MSTIIARQLVILATIIFGVFAFAYVIIPQTLHAQVATVTVHLEKKFSGPVPAGYTADQFSFNVTGVTSPDGTPVNETVNLTAYTVDTANATIDLPMGTYTVEEIGPAGFVKNQWRPSWYGGACDNGSDFSTSMEINASNINHGTIYCKVDNQWRHGNLRVVKNIVGTTTPYENFEFSVTEGSHTIYNGPFESDGDNEFIMGAGDYTVTETVTGNYTPSYSAGCSGTLAEDGRATCTITNTYGTVSPVLGSISGYVWNDSNGNTLWDSGENALSGWKVDLYQGISILHSATTSGDGSYSFTGLADGNYKVCEVLKTNWTQTTPTGNNGCHYVTIFASNHQDVNFGNKMNSGGGGGDDDVYRIEGYVWHDENKNTEWDGFDEEQPTESELPGWKVEITDGQTTLSTTTDPTGYYYFEVPAGTWTITEVLQSGWSITTPASGNFVVTVPNGMTLSFVEQLFALIIPTAHAAVIDVYGPYNFGNSKSSGGGGDPGDGVDPDDDTVQRSGRRGGGSARVSCESLALSGSDGVYTLAWETKRGDQLSITQNGTEIYETDSSDEVDSGSVFVTTKNAEYELTVKGGSRSDTCIITASGNGQVLGEQVSVLPLGAANTGSGGTSIPATHIIMLLMGSAVRTSRDGR